MPVVVGVTFRNAGKMYYFDPGALELREGMNVLAQTSRGLELGTVVLEPKEVTAGEIVTPLKGITRIATEEDREQARANRAREQEAFGICQQKIGQHALPMKLIEVESTFDGSRMVFYFGAESRVDFRTLVKDLAGTFKTRIELRQVGVRDEAKLIGGIGTCGRPLCCATFLANFEPVGIKMAKEQGLSLNPLKISGVCGRLLCCLNYEFPIYREAKERFPKVNSEVTTPRGPGKVIEIGVLKETVTVLFPEGGHAQFPLAELSRDASGPTAAGGLCRKEGSRHRRPCQQAAGPLNACGHACPAQPAAAPSDGGQRAPAPQAPPPAVAAPSGDPAPAQPGAPPAGKRSGRHRRWRRRRSQNSPPPTA